MVKELDDTIAAIATPLGEGGVGVVRVSGDQVIRISGTIIKDFPQNIEPRRVYHGWVVDNGKPVDEVLFCYMQAPNSYTGEDVVEINCHGGIAVLKAVLETTLKAGARMAERGEFTKRAFLNGKIDLMQAEAILDLVKAKTSEGVGAAVGQLEGRLSQKIHEMREELISLQAGLEATVDFPEDVSEIRPEETGKSISKTISSIDKLLETADLGKIIREGLATVIIGKPNVGKSSLLNALLKEDRAIVTEIPGTTRDTIEETVNLQGLPLRIIDTAGIRHPKDKVEEFGVLKAKNELRESDLAIIVMDASQELDENDLMIVREAKDKKAVIALNKIDLGLKINSGEIKKLTNGLPAFKISALKGDGLPQLEEGILQYIGFNKLQAGNGGVIINLRHKDCLLKARQSLAEALNSAQNKMSADFIAIDLKGAILALGEAAGEAVSEEIINKIFEEFCVGK